MFPLLAHGALGPYDELIYLGVAVVFIVMMIVSWFQSRMLDYDDDKTKDKPQLETVPRDEERTAERFTLD